MQVAVSLLVIGFFLVIILNANHLVGKLTQMLVVQVFIRDEASEESISELGERLRDDPAVAEVKFVSKEEALRRFREFQRRSGLAEVDLEELNEGEIPLPASYEVKVRRSSELEEFVARVKRYPEVLLVRYPAEVARSLAPIIRLGQLFIGLTMILLLLFAYSSISNVIRLSVEARKREIRIMQLVGATDFYIRTPYLLEGVASGVVGSGLALVLIVGVYLVASKFLGHFALLRTEFIPLDQMVRLLSLVLVSLGAVIGLMASHRSVSAYLRRDLAQVHQPEQDI